MNPAAKVEAAEGRTRLEDKWKCELIGKETRADHIGEEFNCLIVSAGVRVGSDHDIPEEKVETGLRGGVEDGTSSVDEAAGAVEEEELAGEVEVAGEAEVEDEGVDLSPFAG